MNTETGTSTVSLVPLHTGNYLVTISMSLSTSSATGTQIEAQAVFGGMTMNTGTYPAIASTTQVFPPSAFGGPGNFATFATVIPLTAGVPYPVSWTVSDVFSAPMTSGSLTYTVCISG